MHVFDRPIFDKYNSHTLISRYIYPLWVILYVFHRPIFDKYKLSYSHKLIYLLPFVGDYVCMFLTDLYLISTILILSLADIFTLCG